MDLKLTAAQRQDIMNWDVENWSKALPFWMEHTKLDPAKCRALEIGSYNGGITLFLALQGVTVVCSDVNGPAQIAKDLHKKYGVDGLVTYEDIDAVSLPFPDASFDLVAFKSVMGHKCVHPNREKIFAELLRVLKPGGELWFAENLRGSTLHMAARNLLLGRVNEWRYFSQREIEDLCAPFAEKSFRQYGFLGAFLHGSPARVRAVQKTFGAADRVLSAVVPARWKYIVFGWARK